MTASHARIELCGHVTAELGGRRVEAALPGRKGRLLFARLVLGRTEPIGRDELIDVLWPDAPPLDPDAALSTLLTRLRTALGSGAVLGRAQLRLELGPDAYVDWEHARDGLAAAERMLAAGDARRALAQCASALEIGRRPLLPGLSTPWLEDRRRELEDLRAALLETEARAALHLGGDHLPLAERSARELIALEPYRESAYGLAMRAHAARGDLAEALRRYDELRARLRDELGLTPSTWLSELVSRLIADAATATPPAEPGAASSRGAAPLPRALSAAPAPPHGELHRSPQRLLDRPAGAPPVLALTGAGSAGTSRLVAELAARAHAAGHEVLHGCDARNDRLIARPFVEALREHLSHGDGVARELVGTLAPELAELARHVPELRRVASDWAAAMPATPDVRLQRVCDGVAGLCAALAGPRPLLVVLQHLHWADRSTAAVLEELAHVAQGRRMTVLVVLAPDEPLRPELRQTLEDLQSAGLLERIAPGGPHDVLVVAAQRGAPAGRAGRRGARRGGSLRARAGRAPTAACGPAP